MKQTFKKNNAFIEWRCYVLLSEKRHVVNRVQTLVRDVCIWYSVYTQSKGITVAYIFIYSFFLNWKSMKPKTRLCNDRPGSYSLLLGGSTIKHVCFRNIFA